MLILLHGLGGRPEAFAATLEQLSPGARHRAVALPGHDPAFPLPEAACFDDAVRSIVDRLPDRFELLGYSLGARLALAIALDYPDRVERLSLVGVHGGLEDAEERAARRTSDADWAKRLRTRGLDDFFSTWDEAPLFQSRKSASPVRMEQMRAWRRTHDPEQLARVFETMGLAEMPDYRGRMAELEVKTTLVVGGLDLKFRAQAEGLLPLIRDASLHVVSDIGHDVSFEAPKRLAAYIARAHLMA